MESNVGGDLHKRPPRRTSASAGGHCLFGGDADALDLFQVVCPGP